MTNRPLDPKNVSERLEAPAVSLKENEVAAVSDPSRPLTVPALGPVNTVAEVAAFVKVSKRTIERAIKVGELDVMRAGAAPRITDDAVWKWLHRDSPGGLSSQSQQGGGS